MEINLTPDAKLPETKPTAAKVEKFKNREMCYWNILEIEDGIEASNAISGETFIGSIADFNAALKV